MIFDIVLVVWICICFNFCWHEISKQEKDIDDLSTKYFILKDKTRDLENRIRFLEMYCENEKARSALPKVTGFTYKI